MWLMLSEGVMTTQECQERVNGETGHGLCRE
jgi:hypothetical protein